MNDQGLEIIRDLEYLSHSDDKPRPRLGLGCSAPWFDAYIISLFHYLLTRDRIDALAMTTNI